ncbi:hypothetical protein [Streptomyces chilikensis]|uniref:Uncharacterized protein n=1 Tax=Streptomyces chilikensis TaxID=1194079 RepID=A0ABV3EYU1_9ACTN
MREEPGRDHGESATAGAVAEPAARLRLAATLRSWWQEDPGRATQSSLARRLGERGVKTSQEMLSRYLHRTRPTLARPDVIRALHAVLGRGEEELEEALELHAAARGDGVPGVATTSGAGGSPAGGGEGGAVFVPGQGAVAVVPGGAAGGTLPAPAGGGSPSSAPAGGSVGGTATAAHGIGARSGAGAVGQVPGDVGAGDAVVAAAHGSRPYGAGGAWDGTPGGVGAGGAPDAPPGGAGADAVVAELRWRRWSAVVTAAAAAAAGMVLTAAVTLGDVRGETRGQAPVCPVAPSGPASPRPS